jgi:TrmH RNA methyltransferase
MGAIFAQPPLTTAISETPRPRLGLDAHNGGELEAAIASAAPRTVCLGAERAGLGTEAISACDALATISVTGAAESLNVAATAAIVLHRISSTAPRDRPGKK